MADALAPWDRMQRLHREPERTKPLPQSIPLAFREGYLERHCAQALVHGVARWLTEAAVRELEQSCPSWNAQAFLPDLQRAGATHGTMSFEQRGKQLAELALVLRKPQPPFANLCLHGGGLDEPAWKVAQTAFGMVPTPARRVLWASTLEAAHKHKRARGLWQDSPADYLGLAFFALHRGDARDALQWASQAGLVCPNSCLPPALSVLAASGLGETSPFVEACIRLEAKVWPGDPLWRWLMQHGANLVGEVSGSKDRASRLADAVDMAGDFPRVQQWLRVQLELLGASARESS